MDRKHFFNLCAAAAAGAALTPGVAHAGSSGTRVTERFNRMWSLYGQYRAGTPGIGEQGAWAEKSLLRAVAREMEVMKREILSELRDREAGR